MTLARRRTKPGRVGPLAAGARRERGALLLEVMLSLALFIGAGGTVLGIVSQGVGALRATRDRLHASDLARSAMAEIESGLASPETLNGPAPTWGDPDDPSGEPSLSDGEWELRIETSATRFSGLTLVVVTAEKTASHGTGAAYTLRQLVRLSVDAEDTIGEPDEISEAAERGERRAPGPAPAPATRARPRPGEREGPP